MMNATEIKQFEIGKTYSMRSVCDYNCVWTYTVKSRTDATITTECGKTLRIIKKLTEWNGSETVKPLGSFSMCPVLKA